MKIGIREQIYIIGAGFFLLSLFVFLFVIMPVFNGLLKDSSDLLSQKSKVLVLEEEFNEAGSFQKKYQQYQSDLQKTDDLFVDSKNPVVFIKFLEESASDCSLDLEISAPSFSTENNIFYANFQLSVLGDFSGIVNFVKTLESGRYLVKVQSLNVSDGKLVKQAKANDSSASIFIKVFAQ